MQEGWSSASMAEVRGTAQEWRIGKRELQADAPHSAERTKYHD